MVLLENWSTVSEFLIIITITIFIGGIFKYYYDRRRIFELGSKLPGPKPWPIIGNAWDFLGSELDIVAKLKKYQAPEKILAIWLGHELNVFLYSPEFAQIYCQSPDLLKRSGKLKFAEYLAPKGLLLSNGADWKKAKKIMESALPSSLVKNSIPFIQRQAEILAQRLECEIGKPNFSILHYFQECTFDIICGVTVELELKAQKAEVPLLENVDTFSHLVRKRLYNALYQWDFIYKLFPEGKQFYSIVESTLSMVDEILMGKKKKYEEGKGRIKSEGNQPNGKKKIFLESLFDDETLSLTDVRDHVVSMIMAGFETTAATLSVTMVLLGLHQDIQEKAFQEVSSAIDGDLNDEKVHQLKYLEMVIKETFRILPTVPLGFRKATEDIRMGDFLIPAGAEVGVNIYALHRDPEQYDNPDEFNPDNFLPENIAKRHPYSFLPFTSGLRKCIGSKLAMMMIKVVAAELLLNYKFECDYKTIDDIEFRGDISLELNDGGRVRILKRQ